MKRAWIATLFAGSGAVLLIAGCATSTPEPAFASIRSGDVGAIDITRRAAFPARVELARNETFQMPLAERGNALPLYPEALLAERLPAQHVCLRVSVDTDGSVMSSAPMVAVPDCPSPGVVDPLFFAAAEVTVTGWRFDPAARCTFEGGKPADADGCIGASKVPQAVSLAYRFVFEQKEGRGMVRIGE